MAYDALISATYLERDLERMDKCECFRSKAETLRVAIEKYFGPNVEGYETYKYCIEEEALRSWICLPLVVGIYDRAEETVGALLSEKLRVGEGLVSRSGEKTFWDRSTLYALRGIFYAGYGADALELLGAYSKARVLGEHIPYAVEAFPEGNQAHLSAESGLYLRIFTEGILGYRPTGLRTFELAPHLPGNWGKMQIRNIRLCGTTADVRVERKCERYHIYLRTADTVTELGMNEGEKLELQL